MKSDENKELVKCLAYNLDIFAWDPSDILGISISIAQHCLGIVPGAKPIKQKKRNFHPERQVAAKVEIEKIASGGFQLRSTIS